MNILQKKKYWIWLSRVKNLGSKRIQKLLENYKTPEKIYQLDMHELMKNQGIGEQMARNILDDKIRKNMNKYINYMNENKIDIVTINEQEYPPILKNIYDPPIILYVKGNKNILSKKSIAIIGCREASDYGKSAAKYFAYNLAKENINIVSGLAKGIDSFSHIGAVIAKSPTVAVVGNGLDMVYPKENTELVDNIIKYGGAIVSEYPLGTKPEKMNFPARNRIISGMSNAIVVIEAKEKSGTLITVDFALEQGRDVYVVPGNINSANSVGTNELIKEGAKVVTHYGELLL